MRKIKNKRYLRLNSNVKCKTVNVFKMEKEKALHQIKEILNEVQLNNPEMPGGMRILNNDLNETATEIIKIMTLHTFTETELYIVMSLVAYRITGQWVDFYSLVRLKH